VSTISPQLITTCPGCGRELTLGALVCSECHTLIHGHELDVLAREAQAAEANHELATALAIWNRSLALLPEDSKQADWVRDKLRALHATTAAQAQPQNGLARKLGPIGPIAVLLAKTKGLLAAIFKLKFLLSLFAFVAVYWNLYGWRFGVGFAMAILIHELGHYVDIKRRGWPAEMPVFLPGLGAYVRWEALGVTLRQRAEVSLAGPLAGLIAAIICEVLYVTTGSPVWSALARTGAVINILNLIPVWVLDGGQAAGALGRPERLVLLAAALALWLFTSESIFFLVALGALWRVFTKDLPSRTDWKTLAYYSAVMTALGITLMAVPGSPTHR
jgi:Zn-dependent protease